MECHRTQMEAAEFRHRQRQRRMALLGLALWAAGALLVAAAFAAQCWPLPQ